MRVRWMGTLLVAATVLAGCGAYEGPTASCFSLIASEPGGRACEFRPLTGVEGLGP